MISENLTIKELSALAGGIDTGYIRKLIGQGRIKAHMRAGAWFIPVDEAKRWLRERTTRTRRRKS